LSVFFDRVFFVRFYPVNCGVSSSLFLISVGFFVCVDVFLAHIGNFVADFCVFFFNYPKKTSHYRGFGVKKTPDDQ